MSRAVLAVAVALVALVAAAAADPASPPPSKEQVHFTAADQAAARRAVLRLADLGSSGWQGGRVKPNVGSGLVCSSGYAPKQSDLVLTGAAESAWHRTGLQVRSVAQVLKTRAMVARDWARTVTDPRAVACLRGVVTKGLTASERLVSFRRLPFPRIAEFTTAYRAIVEVSAGGARARVLVDLVLVGRSRTELTLIVAAPAAAGASIAAADGRLARALAARVSA